MKRCEVRRVREREGARCYFFVRVRVVFKGAMELECEGKR